MSVLGSLLAAAGALGGAFISKSGQAQANKQNERLMDKQNAWNLEMWKRQNEYNDPSKQVERFKRAGINPAIALSGLNPGIADGSTSAAASPMGNENEAFASSLPSAGLAIADLFMRKRQVDIQDKVGTSQTELNEASARKEDAQANYYNKQANKIEDNMDADTALKQSQAALNNLLAGRVEKLTPLEEQHLAKQIEEASSRIDLMSSQRSVNASISALNWSNVGLNEVKARKLEADIMQCFATAAYLSASTKLTEAQIEEVTEKVLKLKAETYGIKLSNGFFRDTFHIQKDMLKANHGVLNAQRANIERNTSLAGWNTAINGVNAFANVVGALKPGVSISRSNNFHTTNHMHY